MRILVNERLSDHKFKTSEGYLICTDAILARTGKQIYRRCEIFNCDDESEIEVDRKAEEVFSDKTLASFENKPITVEHPDTDVNVENHNEYSVGFVRDVHRGEVNGKAVMLATLVITDKKTIEEIENGQHCELSCGYDCDIDDSDNPEQKNIRGNHVALCEHGRAGIAKIVDSIKDEDKYLVYAEGTKQKSMRGDSMHDKASTKELNMLKSALTNVSGYTHGKDLNVEDILKKIDSATNGYYGARLFIREKIEGWTKMNDGMYRKDYYFVYNMSGDKIKILIQLYTPGSDNDWKTSEVNAYVYGIEHIHDSVYTVEFTHEEDGIKKSSELHIEAQNKSMALTKAQRAAKSIYYNADNFNIKDTKGDFSMKDTDKSVAIEQIKQIMKKPGSVTEDWEGCQYLSRDAYSQIQKIAKDANLTKQEMRSISYLFNEGNYGSIVDSAEIMQYDSVNDALTPFEITWIDTYQKSQGYDSVFWRHVDIIKANTLKEALEKLKVDAVMRGTGSAYVFVMNIRTPKITYQFSGKIDKLIKEHANDSCKDSLTKDKAISIVKLVKKYKDSKCEDYDAREWNNNIDLGVKRALELIAEGVSPKNATALLETYIRNYESMLNKVNQRDYSSLSGVIRRAKQFREDIHSGKLKKY